MSDKSFYPNSTQVANFILDNLSFFTDGELRIMLIICRKTIGWHKETDYLTYNLIRDLSGIKSKDTLSRSIQCLLKRGFILRLDEQGDDLTEMPQGFRGKVFYTLSKEVLSTDPKFGLVDHLCKIWTSTVPKFGHNKTNSYKTNTLSKDNGEPTGLNNLGGLLKARGFAPKEALDGRVANGWQFYALEVIKVAGFSNGGRARIFKLFKDKNLGYGEADRAKSVVKNDNYLKLETEDARVRYLITALKS